MCVLPCVLSCAVPMLIEQLVNALLAHEGVLELERLVAQLLERGDGRGEDGGGGNSGGVDGAGGGEEVHESEDGGVGDEERAVDGRGLLLFLVLGIGGGGHGRNDGEGFKDLGGGVVGSVRFQVHRSVRRDAIVKQLGSGKEGRALGTLFVRGNAQVEVVECDALGFKLLDGVGDGVRRGEFEVFHLHAHV